MRVGDDYGDNVCDRTATGLVRVGDDYGDNVCDRLLLD